MLRNLLPNGTFGNALDGISETNSRQIQVIFYIADAVTFKCPSVLEVYES
jgi:hypothetical protein